MNNQIIRWGIIGTGRIARAFAEGLRYTNNGKLCATASRNLENAQAFAQELNIPHAFGSYEALAQSEEVDAVYIAPPLFPCGKCDFMHEKSKSVLCENRLR